MRRTASHRRGVLAGGIVLALVAVIAGSVAAQPLAAPLAAPQPDDMSIGSPRAPVTVVEYASLGCPHCGVWARDVFPAFKAAYVDTGKARFVLREMLFGNSTMAAAGFLIAHCAGTARYFDVVDGVFADQAKIEEGGADAMLQVAKARGGMTEEQFKSCLRDPGTLQALEARANRYITVDKITGTPTFVIGDKTLEGEQSLADIGAAIAAATHH